MEGKLAWGWWLALALLLPISVHGAVIELSSTAAYSKTDFEDYKNTQRRFTGSIDFKFTPVSALQFEYMDSLSKTTTKVDVGLGLLGPNMQPRHQSIRDRVYSFSWVQNLVPSKWIIQPYVLIGGGKMERKYRDEIPARQQLFEDSQKTTTGVAGAGMRVFFLRNLALKAEVKTYVPKFKYSEWKHNQLLSLGFSWLF